ncbi:MAG: ECF transporter S component [Oscillospiraceae bacterium]|nr:ECF transporter S component [Oscillospiraceae bacterium]
MSTEQNLKENDNKAGPERPAAKRPNVRKLTTLALLAAIAYVIMVVGRVPIVMFLKYDPKDVIIAVAGFIFGPLSAFFVSVVVSFAEMITVSDTGPWGFLMNVISTCAFVCPAAYIYKRKTGIKSAITGLVAGGLLTVIVMMLWNYLITPIYLGFPRQAVAELLLPVFLPFNALKVGLNGTLTILLYKPVVKSLRRLRLVEATARGTGAGGVKFGVIIITFAVFVTLIVLALVMKGII